MIASILPLELQQRLEAQEPIQLIDIRENYEFEEGHLPAENIPMDELVANPNLIRRDVPVIVYCKTGKRGAAMVYMFKKMHSLDHIINLEGGYEAYTSLN